MGKLRSGTAVTRSGAKPGRCMHTTAGIVRDAGLATMNTLDAALAKTSSPCVARAPTSNESVTRPIATVKARAMGGGGIPSKSRGTHCAGVITHAVAVYCNATAFSVMLVKALGVLIKGYILVAIYSCSWNVQCKQAIVCLMMPYLCKVHRLQPASWTVTGQFGKTHYRPSRVGSLKQRKTRAQSISFTFELPIGLGRLVKNAFMHEDMGNAPQRHTPVFTMQTRRWAMHGQCRQLLSRAT